MFLPQYSSQNIRTTLGWPLVVFFVIGLCFFSPERALASTLPSSLRLSAGDYIKTLSSNDLASWFQVRTRLVLGSKQKSEIENTAYCPTDPTFCRFSLSRYARTRLESDFHSEANKESIEKFVTAIATEVNQDPVDAVFGVDSESKIIVSQPEKLGRKLKEAESVLLLLRAIQGESKGTLSITLPTEVTQPKIIASDKERLGLKELIGQGQTDFKGSPKNRIYNIKRALQQFENILIAPGETFSFVNYLGEVDGEHGYLPELVIKHNRTEPEFGGGICQVSTTVFRAAIYSGLKITERRNHAYPVQYYKPYGMDATIYIPKPDLGFTNNTPGYILMQSAIEGTALTFRFFGTKDGRQIKVDGPHILERGGDGSMKTVFTQLVTDNAGNDFIKDSFWSNYKSPSLFPHPGEDTTLTEKPKDWSEKQWRAYKQLR